MQTVYANNNKSLIPIDDLVLGRKYIMEIPIYNRGWIKIVAKVLQIEHLPLQPYVKLSFHGYVNDEHKNMRKPWAITSCPYRLSEIRNVEYANRTVTILYCLTQKGIMLPPDIVIDLFNLI